jgi:hypothetical protein
VERLVGQRAQPGDFAAEPVSFVPRGQTAAPQQMGRFLEADTARELAQLIAGDDELACLPIDMAEPGLRGDDAVESTRLYRVADETAFTS